MSRQKLSQQVMWTILITLILVGCGAPSATPTPLPPTATPMAPTATLVPPTPSPEPPTATPATKQDRILQLSFDGESCTYEGPTALKAGPITLLFLNESEELATVNLMRHTGDETIQDMIDHLGEEPSHKHAPLWTISIPGVWRSVRAGESHTWEGVLEPGIHTTACKGTKPTGVWFGAGFMVED